MKKKYAIVGAGNRGLHMFAKPLTTDFGDVAELVGIHDRNSARAKLLSDECGGTPVYSDFDRMLSDSGAETIIVTTVDSTHHEYIIRALHAGCDAITEKPMTTDSDKCRAILKAEKDTGKKVTVTFNMRYFPYALRIKELLQEGVVGNVTSINLEYMLNTVHGANYFRRWHRHLEQSGGLLVHKSTHHFDMINWWIDDEPDRLYAFGDTKFYGPTRLERGERCLTCVYKNTCEFYMDIQADEWTRKLYHDTEKVDGYIRDKCVFGEDITTYDTMSVNVRYAGGAFLNYSLNAHAPYEGWKASINGTEGRIEAEIFLQPHNAEDSNEHIRVYNRRGVTVTYPIAKSKGDHGGSDEKIREAIFRGQEHDPFNQQAGTREGAMSILIGIAANLSIAHQHPVNIRELLEDKPL